MRAYSRSLVLTFLLLASAATPVSAQSLRDRIKRRAEDAVGRKADRMVDCVVGDAACAAKAKADGKTVNDVPAATDSAETNAPKPTVAPAPADTAATSRPGEGAWLNYDFVPGDRALFVDDFGKDVVGDFPRRLEFLKGNMEIAEWEGLRLLRATSWPAVFAIDLGEQLPERFTLEFDYISSKLGDVLKIDFDENERNNFIAFRDYAGKGQGGVQGGQVQALSLTRSPLGKGVVRVRVMADGQYVKVYVGDTRVANVPNADLGRSKQIRFSLPGKEADPSFLGNISLMGGGRKLYDAIAAEGRVATQGIYFDTGSDRIRPESTPTLKEIGAMLTEHPELKLTIEGHTDNVGNESSNQALSEQRASAVARYLSSTYAIDATRLVSRGLGDTKPAAPNATPEGRQTNRRVELVRM